ncbi:MAG: AraC family transcriptional regulator [Alphaproteobacteria bacterium]|nr:AraC family transcriptional regulator [Alphaproteobacteria bacterium]
MELPTTPKSDATWAYQIAQTLEARGGSSHLILREVGLDMESVQGPDAEIALVQEVGLFEAAAKHLADPCFGLHFGSSVDPLDVGLIGYMVASSATLGEAFRIFERYVGVASEGDHVSLQIVDRLAVFTGEIVDPSVVQCQQIEEFRMALIMNLCRFVTERRLIPEWVELRHNRTDNLDEFERVFGAPVYFARRRNAIALDRALLELPCHSADERLLRILKRYCELILKQRREKTDLKRNVEHLIASSLPSGSVSIASIAQELGMGERTLMRRLKESGTSFGQILDEVRQTLAFRYLEEPNARISQIAYMLGYSEPSSFNHAFRRWAGVSPTDHRRGIR